MFQNFFHIRGAWLAQATTSIFWVNYKFVHKMMTTYIRYNLQNYDYLAKLCQHEGTSTLCRAAQSGTVRQGRAAKADQHGQQECHACLHVHIKVTFLGDFFQFTKNVCVTKNSVIISPELCVDFYYVLTLIRESQYFLPYY